MFVSIKHHRLLCSDVPQNCDSSTPFLIVKLFPGLCPVLLFWHGRMDVWPEPEPEVEWQFSGCLHPPSAQPTSNCLSHTVRDLHVPPVPSSSQSTGARSSGVAERIGIRVKSVNVHYFELDSCPSSPGNHSSPWVGGGGKDKVTAPPTRRGQLIIATLMKS